MGGGRPTDIRVRVRQGLGKYQSTSVGVEQELPGGFSAYGPGSGVLFQKFFPVGSRSIPVEGLSAEKTKNYSRRLVEDQNACQGKENCHQTPEDDESSPHGNFPPSL